ncbi:MAG: hypothetical protein LBG94_04550 [Treponema sp.]|jgi:LuxR family maltose regulon positive regulatory protein|nr:hypothetical protein [Treponema sp.]
MPVKNFIDNESGGIPKNADFPERERLNKLFKEAVNYPLIIVCAGFGFGKTSAVYSFVNDYDAYTSWIQITEKDNDTSLFWENYSNNVPLPGSGITESLKKIGFPETDEAFCAYSAVRNEAALAPGKYIRVFDDFHLMRSAEILRFFARSMDVSASNLTLILISRAMPEINLVGMMKREKVFTVQEDALCFTEDEIARYFSRIKLPVTGADIRNFYDGTQGWAFAVNLIARSLSKNQKNEQTHGSPVDAMKKNIFRFMEAEVSKTISNQLARFLSRISLIDHLNASLVKTLAADDTLISQMETLNAYIRYDFTMDTYVINHLFRDYMRQNQLLTDEEKRETYDAAGAWCGENGYYMDSLSYYEKSADYNAIIEKIASFNVQIPNDKALYALNIFDRMPDDVKTDNPLFPAMYIKLKFNLDKLEQAQEAAEQYTGYYMKQAETPQRNRALCAIYTYWGLIRMRMSTYTDVYDFDIYYKYLYEYFLKNPFKPIGSFKTITAESWASNVGTSRAGAMEEYIAAVTRMTSYFSGILTGFCFGLEDLLRGELFFYQRKYNEAEQYLKQSAAKARKQDQYIIQYKAIVYLMHIDLSNGDAEGAGEKLKEMETRRIEAKEKFILSGENDYTFRYTIYDIACGFYYLALDKSDKISEWLKSELPPYECSSFPVNYANRVRLRYHYQTHQYSALLKHIEGELKRPLILFGRIELMVLKALSLYQLKKREEAIAALTEAYNLSESNRIIVSFTEFAEDMRTLTLAAHKDNACPIPKKWLEEINRVSSTYAKRRIKMISEYAMSESII